jgi:hypothetical protein
LSFRFFLDGRVTVHAGDCREVLASLPENSVDSVVCDPPYELGFMGRGWDRTGIANDLGVWAQALRVLKPGGHLLAFSGTRTYHRMTCAIEDAGFEIRDQIGYCFGSGFPKSHNITKAVNGCSCEGSTSAASLVQYGLRPVLETDVPQAGHDGEEREEVLFAGVSEPGLSADDMQCASAAVRRGKQGVEGRRHVSKAARQLRVSQVREMPSRSALHGPEGRLRNGTPPDNGALGRASLVAERVCAPQGPQPAEQCGEQFGTLAGQPDAQAVGAWQLCGRCGKPIVPEGLGSALKPAWEPIVLARKPLIGTIAENVLRWGTGAINIDGCRVEAADNTTKEWRGIGERPRDQYRTGTSGRPIPTDIGRWPANLVLSDDEEVRAAFPETESGGGNKNTANRDERNAFGKGLGLGNGDGIGGDSGSAARFFYTAKAGTVQLDGAREVQARHPLFRSVVCSQRSVRLLELWGWSARGREVRRDHPLQ